MKTENRVTLTQLADHLEKGECIHEIFDFSTWNKGPNFNENIPNCGTNGCALGEMPALDKNWSFDDCGELEYKNMPFCCEDVAEYFGITPDGALHLFYPDEQKTSIFGGLYLTPFATKAEVIHNIREFVRITGKN